MTTLVASVLFAAAVVARPVPAAAPSHSVAARTAASAPASSRPDRLSRVRGAGLLRALLGAQGDLDRVLSPTADTAALAAALTRVHAAPASGAQDVLAAGARDGGPRERDVLGIGAVAAESARAEYAGLGQEKAEAPVEKRAKGDRAAPPAALAAAR